MNAEDKSWLADYAYLWESGEWALEVTRHSRQRVLFVFSAGHATMRELIAVRALLPRFANSPVTELKREVGTVSEIVAGEFPNLEARSLAAAAQARGLQVRLEDVSFTSHTPVTQGACLHIDDENLARRIGEEMKRRGVRIIHAESD